MFIPFFGNFCLFSPKMIDEFTDVNEGEKELMKMWNSHIMKGWWVFLIFHIIIYYILFV